MNFAALRRHLGRPRADALVLDVAARIAELLPDVRILTAGRALIEIGFERETVETGAADIDRLREALADDGADFLHLSLWNASKPTAKRPDIHPIHPP